MKNKRVIISSLLIIQIVALKIISYFPRFVEKYYSNGLYPYISKCFRFILGWIPFSIGDIIYILLILMIIRWLWKIRKSWKVNYKSHFLSITSTLSIGYFLFHLLWAANYHRVPLYQKMNIEKEYEREDLLFVTEQLIKRVNHIHFLIDENDNIKITNPSTKKEVFKQTLNGYDKLAMQYDYFRYDYLSIKPSLISLPLTYMGFAGYLNPFSNEAQVNYKIPMYTFPTVSCHEMAHQLGYASESEANFIGYLASINNDDLYFQYSGFIYALRYCLSNWEVRDRNVYDILLKQLKHGCIENMKESDIFWERYDSVIEGVFKQFYDNYLKINQQKDGLKTYTQFVGLLVNYHKLNPFY